MNESFDMTQDLIGIAAQFLGSLRRAAPFAQIVRVEVNTHTSSIVIQVAGGSGVEALRLLAEVTDIGTESAGITGTGLRHKAYTLREFRFVSESGVMSVVQVDHVVVLPLGEVGI